MPRVVENTVVKNVRADGSQVVIHFPLGDSSGYQIAMIQDALEDAGRRLIESGRAIVAAKAELERLARAQEGVC